MVILVALVYTKRFFTVIVNIYISLSFSGNRFFWCCINSCTSLTGVESLHYCGYLNKKNECWEFLAVSSHIFLSLLAFSFSITSPTLDLCTKRKSPVTQNSTFSISCTENYHVEQNPKLNRIPFMTEHVCVEINFDKL